MLYINGTFQVLSYRSFPSILPPKSQTCDLLKLFYSIVLQAFWRSFKVFLWTLAAFSLIFSLEGCIWPFSWSIHCSLKPHQKRSPWKRGCQEAILKEGKQGEKYELCQITQELDWKSVATGLMEGWILSPEPRPQHKQHGIMLTDNGTKGSQHPKKSFGMSFEKPGELFLKTT